jgi:hypothetical protein
MRFLNRLGRPYSKYRQKAPEDQLSQHEGEPEEDPKLSQSFTLSSVAAS